jgi:hypothetical protein
MTALVGDVIIPVSHGFDLGPFILGCALVSVFAFTLAALNRSWQNRRPQQARAIHRRARDLHHESRRGDMTGVDRAFEFAAITAILWMPLLVWLFIKSTAWI